MRYSKTRLDAVGYELGPVVVGSAELEARLKPLYEKLRLCEGQLEQLTGIAERRWWEEGYPLSEGAVRAAKKALEASNVRPGDIGALVYAGVCREHFEPATACRVADGVGVGGGAMVYDISNACLGVLNGIVDIANRIELGHVRAGMVVSCESAREINVVMIERMLKTRNMDFFKTALATLTGGSGAVALILTDGSFSPGDRRRLVGGAAQAAPEHHELSVWGLDRRSADGISEFMAMDAVPVLRHGVQLGIRTWGEFLKALGWSKEQVDKVICHQVGAANKDSILKELGISEDRDFSSFAYLGNMGTVSLPLTAALAEERGFLRPGDRVAFLGIGSGLNCLMLGWEW
ncbi:MAG: 3-oxoacyl-ACP synthase III [Elusimicrobiota bacterium]